MSTSTVATKEEAKSLPGCSKQSVASRSREVTLLLCSALHIQSAVYISGLPGISKPWTYLNESSER